VTAITLTEVHRGNPLEVVEHIATNHLWSFERACDDELVIVVEGKWAEYQVSFTWMHDMEALHLAFAFDLKTPERNHAEIEHLIPMINAQMWVGHFEFWPTDKLVVFRHTRACRWRPGVGPTVRGALVRRPRRMRALLLRVPVCSLGRRGRARGS
jgi:hypothetical protein